MTAHVQEDAFHEIQLNGKQLVFMFMVATVASVVIFLSGVFVGRGVRVERSGSEDAAALIEAPAADATPAKNATGPTPAQGADPRVVAPPPAVDDQSYVARLEKRNPPVEDLKPASAPAATPPASASAATKPAPAPPPPVKATPRSTDASVGVKATDKPVGSAAAATSTAAGGTSASPAATPVAAPAAPGASPASGQGFVVQVAALNVRSEAEAIAKRLVAKGYAAFVQTPSNGTPAVFRVRIGPVSTRQEADTLAAKLQKEEQFKPWITR